MSDSTALHALRAATAEEHRSLEGGLRIAAAAAGRGEYAAHVAGLWGWLAPIEENLWGQAWPAGFDTGARNGKAAWLEQDIAVARGAGFLDAVAQREAQPAFASLGERMGWAYVIEGSMLGGQVLLRRLHEPLAPWPLRWLHGYGAEQPRRWRDFLAALGQHVRSDRDISRACEGAREAFATLSDWLHAHDAARR